ncbi:ankyrin repeat domain-containing protein 24 isoform X2 [Paroedura picta]|uniref:ankyrin repeat domain-containing protein 24 isoform X2 n=1 Tax=Paroedura picta TaxID=143630 RepID=UPI00405735F2
MAARYLLGGTMKQICFCAASSFASQDWSKNDEKLLQAVEYNDAERVASLLLRKGLVPTKLDSEGKSAFHLASMKGNVDCLEVMLAHGADAMTTDSSGCTALHLSAKHGHPQCMSKLLQASCPVDLADSNGRTALHHAALSGCISCLEILCDFKASLNTKDQDGATPLMLAAKMSHSELCRYLLHRGAAVNTRDQRGRTALMVACENGSVETVEVLVHGGARVSLVDATGHDATHYGAAVGNALIQHYLQEAAHRHSWTSEESDRLSSQASSPRQSLSKGKNSSPRKRKAPPPPPCAPNQHTPHPSDHASSSAERSNRVVTAKPARGHAIPTDVEEREAYEEIVRLRQERAQLLQRIRSLELQQEKQEPERPGLEDDALHTMEKQIQDLQKQLSEKTDEKENLGKELEFLRSHLSSLENEKENTSYDIETLQDEELLEFPGAELLLSKKSLSISTEELLATLQGQVQSLTQKNKELMEKIQILENYERDESDADVSGDFIPIILYDSLRSEFDLLKAQHAEAQAALEALEGGATTNEASCKLVSAEAYENLKSSYEQQIRALKESLEKSGSPTSGEKKNSGLGMEEEEVMGSKLEEMAKVLSETQEKYQAALQEASLLQEQIELGILSVEEKDVVESSRAELETVKAALHQAQEDLKARDQKVKDLEGRLKETAVQGPPTTEYEEMKASLAISLEEASREKEALLMRCSSAEAEVKELRETLEEKIRETEKAERGLLESQSLREEASNLQKRLEAETKKSEEARAQMEKIKEGHKKLEKELQVSKDRLASQYIPKQEHEETVAKTRSSLSEAERQLAELKEKHAAIQKELTELQKKSESYRRESVPITEHARAKEALEGTLWELKAKSKLLEQELNAKNKEFTRLQVELDAVRQDAVSKEVHEQLRASLQGEVEALNAKLADLGRKHERTCTEVFQVQREALFMKSEKHAAEAQLAAAEKQLKSLRAESDRIQELHSHIEDSAKLVKEKDKKITELSKEVFKLKEALNELSELSGQAGPSPKAISPQKTENRQEVAMLQGKIHDLEQQLAEAERRHTNVISLYRGHLLYAIQGHMDEDIQRILFQILKMQRLQEQGR